MKKVATLIPVQNHETVEEAAKALGKSISDFFNAVQEDTNEESSDADDLSGAGAGRV